MTKSKTKDDIKKELTKLISSAKKEPSFGLALASKQGEDLVLETSRMKKGPALMKVAKKAAGGSKTTHGKLKLISGKVYFECAEEPPAGCLRKLKAYFKKYDAPAKLGLILPNGQIAADEDDAPETPDAQAATVKAFHETTRKLMPHFDTVDGLKAKTDGLITEMEAILKADDFDQGAADAVIKKLVALVPAAAAPAPDGSAPEPSDADKLITVFKKVAPRLVEIAKADPSKAEAVKRINAAAKDVLKSKPVDAAALEKIIQAATKLMPKPGAQAAPADGSAEDAKADDPVNLAIKDWSKTTAAATAEISALQKVIEDACADQPGAGKVKSAFEKITGKLGKLNTAIDGSLNKAMSAGDAAKQKAAASEAATMAADVSALLKKDAVLSKLDDNPFQKIKAHGALVKCLDDIQKELAA